MMCKAYFGALSEERKANWDNKDSDPYKVLNSPIELYGKGHILLSSGSDYFHDRISIDWGSDAWKCTADEIIEFLEDHKETLSWLIEDDIRLIKEIKEYVKKRGNIVYGVVFIEEP